MSTTVEYFKVKLQPNSQVYFETIGKSENDCKKEFIQNLLDHAKQLMESDKIFENENNFIEISDVNEGYIFGIIGKSSPIMQSPLKRIKDIKGKKIDETDLSMEDYRYFLMEVKSLKCAVIRNTDAPAFRMLFMTFLKSFNKSILSNISVLPIIDNNLNTKLKKFNEIIKLSLVFDNESSMSSQLTSLKNTLYISNSATRKIGISIWLQEQKVDNNLIELLQDEEFIRGDFKKFEVSGTNEDNQKETLEFVERILTRTFDISISKEALINGEKYLYEIKEALIKSLEVN